MDSSKLHREAKSLVENLAETCSSKNGMGSMSASIYDTAWVAMISKKVSGGTEWLIPASFRFLLDSQLPSGAWDSYASEVDGILNTMAALLVLKTHTKTPWYTGSHLPEDVDSRISRATSSLSGMLSHWNVEETVHVGFEMLVPSLLRLLEDGGLFLDFPGRASLMALNEEKLTKFDVSMLYGTEKSTLLHSMEAFIGNIDFDQVSHQMARGSLMASPASTAAYLIYSSCWDEQAETYLRMVVAAGSGKANGSVPSASPITIFEVSWAISTLLESGYSTESLAPESMETIAKYLKTQLEDADGVVGFGTLNSLVTITGAE